MALQIAWEDLISVKIEINLDGRGEQMQASCVTHVGVCVREMEVSVIHI